MSKGPLKLLSAETNRSSLSSCLRELTVVQAETPLVTWCSDGVGGKWIRKDQPGWYRGKFNSRPNMGESFKLMT